MTTNMTPGLLAGIASTQEGITHTLAELRDLLNRLTDRSDAITRNLTASRGDGLNQLDAAMFSVWLHGDWRWLTQKMATEQREAAADAVQRADEWAARDEARPNDPITDLRWW